ncbi:MAG TPA: acyl-CoA dehydrogenase family protein [Mycobacteriales bacterium]|jgi:alkylation response protein AidB-like acyl-CoA dehydrogenase|nr:acyl-CoA dehydrogenase family protein [Mycobacteriales bacterium]
MDFSYSADQEELRDSVRRFLTDKSPLAKVRADIATELGYDQALWQQMSSQLGLPGLHLPEEHDGSGTGLLEPAVVLEEVGRSLTSTPYAAVLFASLAVLHLGSKEWQAELLPGLASGETIATLATIEVASPTGASALATTAQSRGDQVTLTGAKTLVEHGHSADVLLVSAVGDGGATRLYVVQGDAPGLTRTRLDALDLTRPLAEVRLDAVPAVLLGDVDGLDGLVDVVCALLASEMVGGTAACLEMATAYAKDRFQFNRPIGSFQAVKHRLAEMLVALDGARAAAQYAVLAADTGSPELATVAPLAKAEASEAYTFAAGWNIQVHGGVGFTWEQDAHLYFRRAWTDSALYGVPAAQRARLADRLGL